MVAEISCTQPCCHATITIFAVPIPLYFLPPLSAPFICFLSCASPPVPSTACAHIFLIHLDLSFIPKPIYKNCSSRSTSTPYPIRSNTVHLTVMPSITYSLCHSSPTLPFYHCIHSYLCVFQPLLILFLLTPHQIIPPHPFFLLYFLVHPPAPSSFDDVVHFPICRLGQLRKHVI